MMIQDSFVSYVIPRIEKMVRYSVVIGDERGRAILTNLGLPLSVQDSQINFTMKFRYCYTNEWISELQKLQKDINKYPFLFMNAKGVTYEGDVVTIPEMLIATRTKKEWVASESDTYTQSPILTNLLSYLEDTISCYYGTDGVFKLKNERMYKAAIEGQTVPEYIDAVLIKNTKLRINKTCNL